MATQSIPVMRMLFVLSRADNPLLYDELAKFAKGAKRLNRLRTLAHQGLVLQAQLMRAPLQDDADADKVSPVNASEASAAQAFFRPPQES